MSKSSFIIALLVSLAAHGLLFIGPGENSSAQAEPKPQKVAKLTIPQAKPQSQVKEYPQQPVSKKKQPPEAEQFQEVVKADSHNIPDSIGDFADNDSADTLPRLSLIWDSPEHLIEVAKALGLRVLPVNSDNEPIGELRFERDILVGKFYGGLNSFSNRVRTISARFFGQRVLNQCDQTIRHFWVVVPASIDHEWIKIQKKSLCSEGLTSSQVSYMEAMIVSDENGFRLVITKIITV